MTGRNGMQPGFLGRPSVVAGISAGSALLGLYFIGHYLTASTDERSVIELVIAGGCLLGAIGGTARAVELARQLRAVETTRAGGGEDPLWRVWVVGFIGLVVGGCIGLIGGVGGFAVGLGVFTAAVCVGIFLVARRSRRRS